MVPVIPTDEVTDTRHLKLAFRTVPTPVLLVADSGKILFANAALDALFEYPEGGLVGKHIEVLVPAEARDYHPDLRTAFFEYPQTRRMGTGRDLYGVSKSGKLIPLEIGLNPVQSEIGHVVVAWILDITERKKQESRFRLAVNATANGILMVDRHGVISFCNDQIMEMFGYTERELIGEPIEVLIPENMKRRHSVYRASFTEVPTQRRMGQGRDLFGLRKNGSEFPVEIGLNPLETPEGQFTMATVIDVTERKKREREIREKNAHLSRLNDELKGFAYSVSHDLKAPLSSIEGLTDYILEDIASEDYGEVACNIGRIRGLSQQLSETIEGVLDLSRSDYLDEDVGPVMLEDVMSEVRTKLDHMISDSGVIIETEILEPAVSTTAIRLQQVLENLVSNAIKYRDVSKQDQRIRVLCRRAGDSVILEVEDNGLGIPKDFHPAVFQMFKRFHKTEQPGSGLGLALIKKHVDRMNASISFVSSSAGTMFRIEFSRPVLATTSVDAGTQP